MQEACPQSHYLNLVAGFFPLRNPLGRAPPGPRTRDLKDVTERG